ncbi:MAG: ferrous iron transport protein A [Alphaproteobacteria bacterium]|nr:ferrous iron transport protein A [Alphaproteobacteria bacterium]MBN9566288.1 ferrous iron transport protein A [Alphaproteobacteria bacterium]MBN9571075.1 ferrous iron transport protein A [Alphaproteobacteria bacterium]
MVRISLQRNGASRRAAGRTILRLSELGIGDRGVVIGITPGAVTDEAAIDHAELERRLLEMGFVEGARFQVLHEGLIGRDPIAIRLDDMRVALRRREARAVTVDCTAMDMAAQ